MSCASFVSSCRHTDLPKYQHWGSVIIITTLPVTYCSTRCSLNVVNSMEARTKIINPEKTIASLCYLTAFLWNWWYEVIILCVYGPITPSKRETPRWFAQSVYSVTHSAPPCNLTTVETVTDCCTPLMNNSNITLTFCFITTFIFVINTISPPFSTPPLS